VIVAVSNAYVQLIASDLDGLLENQRARLRLICTADARYTLRLRPYLIAYDSRLDEIVPGSKVDFAQRAAEHFISGALDDPHFPEDADEQRDWVRERLKHIPPKMRLKRKTVDDARLQQLAEGFAREGLSYTGALNLLRQQHGIACEQSRFKRIFLEVTR
jgi:hypothetical protein